MSKSVQPAQQSLPDLVDTAPEVAVFGSHKASASSKRSPELSADSHTDRSSYADDATATLRLKALSTDLGLVLPFGCPLVTAGLAIAILNLAVDDASAQTNPGRQGVWVGRKTEEDVGDIARTA